MTENEVTKELFAAIMDAKVLRGRWKSYASYRGSKEWKAMR